eukprot:CAMPEP_0171799002 /NCGR_PEP_ID=MMETSP0991-20121206/70879_1 /TAXON_ID=483369 /ORGANISM="non described non described, Strain CCMP2098" /LENGTH=133 /DNA_ID=CAMNT_0012410347 /DNA_START=22 /DNA_END=424 /DNA_ORIENTATION=+
MAATVAVDHGALSFNELISEDTGGSSRPPLLRSASNRHQFSPAHELPRTAMSVVDALVTPHLRKAVKTSRGKALKELAGRATVDMSANGNMRGHTAGNLVGSRSGLKALPGALRCPFGLMPNSHSQAQQGRIG